MSLPNIVMAGVKETAGSTAVITERSVGTAAARDGAELGLPLSGSADKWFTGPADIFDRLFLPSFRPEDAGLAIGDLAITKTVETGEFASAGLVKPPMPAVIQAVQALLDLTA